MLTLEDLLKLPTNPTPEHLQALGLLAPRPEPTPSPPLIPSAAVSAPLSPVETPEPVHPGGVAPMRPPTIPERKMEPLTAPETPSPSPEAAGLAPALAGAAPEFPKLSFKEKMALPSTSAGVRPGSANYWENQLVRREEEKEHPWGSPENRPGLMGKIGHVLGRIGNIALTTVAPGVAASVPGTELYKQLEERRAQEELGQAQERESTEKTRELQRQNIESEIGEREKPPKKTPEEEAFEFEKGRGRTPPEALETVKGAGKMPREGELPLGDHVPALNKMLENRFHVLTPGQPLPAE